MTLSIQDIGGDIPKKVVRIFGKIKGRRMTRKRSQNFLAMNWKNRN